MVLGTRASRSRNSRSAFLGLPVEAANLFRRFCHSLLALGGVYALLAQFAVFGVAAFGLRLQLLGL